MYKDPSSSLRLARCTLVKWADEVAGICLPEYWADSIVTIDAYSLIHSRVAMKHSGAAFEYRVSCRRKSPECSLLEDSVCDLFTSL
jgi:hypothetical protein